MERRQLVMVTSQILSETFPLWGVFSSLSGYREIGKINSRCGDTTDTLLGGARAGLGYN